MKITGGILHGRGMEASKKDAWNEFVIKLPEDLDMTLEQQIGVQCEIIGEGNFTIYIDLIEW